MKQAEQGDTGALDALLSTLRRHGVRTYEASPDGVQRVEFYPAAPVHVGASQAPLGPVLAGLKPEAIPGNDAEPVMGPPPAPLGRAAPRSVFSGMDKSNPLFRHVPPEVLE